MNPQREPSTFPVRLALAQQANNSSLCVGLDPEPAALPHHLHGLDGVRVFCREIIAATADLVCAYKPNLAFFERLGADGWRLLAEVVAEVPPGIPVIADGKRGDIGNTSRAYAEALYDQLGAAACTVSPYLGSDAVASLLDHPYGFGFVLCRTSNPGAGVLQDLLVDGEPLYAHVARLFLPWLAAGRAGLVIGAQHREAFAWAAHLAPHALVLVPGIGAQGGAIGDLAAALSPIQTRQAIVSISRSILHAGDGLDYAEVARRAALSYRAALQEALGMAREWSHNASGSSSNRFTSTLP